MAIETTNLPFGGTKMAEKTVLVTQPGFQFACRGTLPVERAERKRKVFFNSPPMLDEYEELAYPPEGGKTSQWLGGAVIALLIAGYGVKAIATGQVLLQGLEVSLELVGSSARCLGVALIGLGALLHFHYFWGLSQRLWPWSQRLKLVSFLILVWAMFYTLYLIGSGTR